MKMKFQWFFDLATEPDQMQIITVSAGGEMVRQRLAPFFSAYKYYKLGNVKLSMVPASTLPVDPLGLKYDDAQYVDPRDQLTPGLTRITNGEDILEDLSGLTPDQQRQLYYTMMLDTRWYKFMLQKGLKRRAVPLYWQIGQYHQDVYPGQITNLPAFLTSGGDVEFKTMVQSLFGSDTGGISKEVLETLVTGMSDPHGIFQTGHKGRLGWLPTDALIQAALTEGLIGADYTVQQPANNPIACIELFKIILPPAHKTKYYYRVFVTETVYFKEPVVNNLSQIIGEETVSYSSLDRFVRAQMPRPEWPTVDVPPVNYPPIPPNDGAGNRDTSHPGPGPDPPDPPVPDPDEFPAHPGIGYLFVPNWLADFDWKNPNAPVTIPDGWYFARNMYDDDQPIGFFYGGIYEFEYQPEYTGTAFTGTSILCPYNTEAHKTFPALMHDNMMSDAQKSELMALIGNAITPEGYQLFSTDISPGSDKYCCLQVRLNS